MGNGKSYLIWSLRIFLAILFLFSAYAKLYGMSPYAAITTFEKKQLLVIGFSESIAPYFSRFIIGAEIALGIGFLQPHYLRKLILPLSALLLVLFNVHLGYSIITGVGGNCGCFGELLPMTPTQAFIKNVITLGLIFWLWKMIKKKQSIFQHNFFVASTLALGSILFMFMIAPIATSNSDTGSEMVIYEDDEADDQNYPEKQNTDIPEVSPKDTKENRSDPTLPDESVVYAPQKKASGFAKYVPGIDDGKKLLLFFAPGCDHCQETAKILNKMAKVNKDFPKMFIIFMDEEPEKIPAFFENAGRKFNHIVMDVGAFWTVMGTQRDTPGVLYLWNGNEVSFYDGINDNAFTEEKMKKALAKEKL